MYTTKCLSTCLNSPGTLSTQPKSPCSASLVYTDEESSASSEDGLCFRKIIKSKKVQKLPFPQDKVLSIRPSYSEKFTFIKVLFIPVLDQPLSANQYYILKAETACQGEAFKCTRDDDDDDECVQLTKCCFGTVTKDVIVTTYPFDYRDIYQRFVIHRNRRGGGFFAESVAPDGSPPPFLGEKGWQAYDFGSNHFNLSPAQGLDVGLRNHSPEFNLLVAGNRSNAVIVGKWYCPSPFVKEINVQEPKKHANKNSMFFYVMTLEQRWEEIYSCDNECRTNVVIVDVDVEREDAHIESIEIEAERDDDDDDDGFIWFRAKTSNKNNNNNNAKVGLSSAIYERLMSVQEGGGWVGDGGGGGESVVRVRRREENNGDNGWSLFGCYVLVESFVLRRMDGSFLLQCDYRHSHRIECQWDRLNN